MSPLTRLQCFLFSLSFTFICLYSHVSVLFRSLRVWWRACLLKDCWLMCVAGLQVLRAGYRWLNERVTTPVLPQSSHTCSEHIRYLVRFLSRYQLKKKKSILTNKKDLGFAFHFIQKEITVQNDRLLFFSLKTYNKL